MIGGTATPIERDALLTREARRDLLLTCAHELFVNGETTQETVHAIARAAVYLRCRAITFPRWGAVVVQLQDDDGEVLSIIEAVPSRVDMDRVACVLETIDRLCDGRMAAIDAMPAIRRIADTPPTPSWLLALAAAIGAVALAILFGISHVTSALLIFVSAAAGALLRHTLARYSANLFVQPFAAALVAGLVGSLAIRYNLSSSLRLVAVCPCMMLAPGPHVLNGMLDFVRGRIDLGLARLAYAALIVVAISMGLLLGLGLFGLSLPLDAPSRAVRLLDDLIAAGVVVACYSVLFSSPSRMVAWPMAVGTLAHGARWFALTVLGASAATGACLACLIAAAILTPVSRRWHMPFAAVGFAAVVSLTPGVFMFRAAGGLVQLSGSSVQTWDIASATLRDSATAGLIVLAMSAGLLVPKLIIDAGLTRARRRAHLRNART
jgi:uncharacterized membrane protein YjjP (DUF1212 family)